MRIAVTYDPSNGEIFQHFGHTEQMKLYEVEDQTVCSSEVKSTNGRGHGALAGFLRDEGVDVLICGGIGGGAQTALAEAGVRLYGGCSGDADQAVWNLLHNVLMYNPNVQCSHHEGGHDCAHDCGSQGDHPCRHGDCGGPDAEEEDQIITLTVTDETGRAEDSDFRLIAIYRCQGRRYVALTPDLDAPELEADIYLFRYQEEGGQCNVEEIADDEEFAAAADAFQNWQLSRG